MKMKTSIQIYIGVFIFSSMFIALNVFMYNSSKTKTQEYRQSVIESAHTAVEMDQPILSNPYKNEWKVLWHTEYMQEFKASK